MKILLTGAGGFLGNKLVEQLSGHHELFCLTRSLDTNLLPVPGVNWIAMDLGLGLDLSRLPEKLDAIVHLAQSRSYTDFPGGAPDVFAVNVRMAQDLCGYGLSAGISRMVLASTGSVYEPYECAMRETDFVRPSGYYASSKLAAEHLSEAYSKHFSVANLRLFFLYGFGQKNMMIARLIENVRNGNKVSLPNDGMGLEFVPTHVSDAARIFVQSLSEGWMGPINVASPHRINLADFLSLISAETGKPLNLEITSQAPPNPIVPNLGLLASKTDMSLFLHPRDGITRTVHGEF